MQSLGWSIVTLVVVVGIGFVMMLVVEAIARWWDSTREGGLRLAPLDDDEDCGVPDGWALPDREPAEDWGDDD